MGEGYKATLKILNQFVGFNFYKIYIWKKVFDWVVPNEWVLKDAYILDPRGKKICDYKKIIYT